MNRPAPEIPGYYYDVEKKKYFKIQPNHAASSAAAYSAADVKRRQARDHAMVMQETLLVRQKGRIRRSKILEDSLLGGCLDRSHGRRTTLNTPQIYADGLVPQGALPSIFQFGPCSDPFFDVDHRTDLGDGLVDVRMVFDDQIFTIRGNVDKYNRSKAHGSVEICHDLAVSKVNRASWRLERFGHPGESTSLSAHSQTRTLAFTWLSGTNNAGIAISPMAGIPIDSDTDRPTILLAPGGLNDVNVWTSTPAPNASSELFAFGTSHGIFTVDKARCDVTTVCPKLADWRNSPTDVFALEYLSDNPSILLSGARSGVLNLIDTRLPFSGRDTITHASTITHIRQLDTHRILVAGLASSLCQYDLRFRKADQPSASSSREIPSTRLHKRKKIHHGHSSTGTPRTPTKPILTYPAYRNSATIRIGLDVNVESGLLAAAQEADGADGTAMVELFSLHGGQKLKSRLARELSKDGVRERERDGGVTKCVRWVDDGGGKGRSLWVGDGKNLKRFAWETWQDGEEDFDG